MSRGIGKGTICIIAALAAAPAAAERGGGNAPRVIHDGMRPVALVAPSARIASEAQPAPSGTSVRSDAEATKKVERGLRLDATAYLARWPHAGATKGDAPKAPPADSSDPNGWVLALAGLLGAGVIVRRRTSL